MAKHEYVKIDDENVAAFFNDETIALRDPARDGWIRKDKKPFPKPIDVLNFMEEKAPQCKPIEVKVPKIAEELDRLKAENDKLKVENAELKEKLEAKADVKVEGTAKEATEVLAKKLAEIPEITDCSAVPISKLPPFIKPLNDESVNYIIENDVRVTAKSLARKEMQTRK